MVYFPTLSLNLNSLFYSFWNSNPYYFICVYCPREFQRVLVSCLAWRSSQMWNPWVAASTKRVMLNTWERTNLGDHTQPQCNQGTDHYKQKKNYVERAFHLLLFILVHDNFCLIIVESNVFHRWLFRQLIVSSLLGLFKLNYCYGSQGSRREWASSKHVFWFYKISKTVRCIRVGKNYHGAKNIHLYHSIAVERFFWKGVSWFWGFYRCDSFIMTLFYFCSFFFIYLFYWSIF